MVWTFGCFAVLGGCGMGAMEVVRTRHARQFQCSEQEVAVTELGGGAWIADGCGQRISYYCEGGQGSGDARCIIESARERAGETQP